MIAAADDLGSGLCAGVGSRLTWSKENHGTWPGGALNRRIAALEQSHGEFSMRAFPTSSSSPRPLVALAIAGALAVVFAAGAPTAASAQATVTTPSGLKITDSKVGTGATPKAGQTCVMHYTGWLYENGQKGKKFDSSVDRGQPFKSRSAAAELSRVGMKGSLP